MKTQVALMLGLIGLGLASLLHGAESAKYPAPRFPSYLRPPKSIDDIMPFARAAVRQTGGRTPLGLIEKGMATLIVTLSLYCREFGVTVTLELVGINVTVTVATVVVALPQVLLKIARYLLPFCAVVVANERVVFVAPGILLNVPPPFVLTCH